MYEITVHANIALTGTPFLFNFEKLFGASPFWDIEKSMRELVYRPEFRQERTAVKIIKFIIWAAAGTFTNSRIDTNGLFIRLDEFHGRTVTKIKIEPK